MKRSILNKLAVIVGLLLCAGCKSQKEIIQPGAVSSSPAQVLPNTATLENIIAGQANFNTLSMRAKANLNIDNKDNDVNMNIRIQKDKAIWISVTIANLEVARALITPDSVKILNRIDNIYIKKPFSYIYEFTNKQLNFNTLQEMLCGNSMPELLKDPSVIIKRDNELVLSGMLDSLEYSLMFNQKYKLVQTNLKDRNVAQTLAVNYGDFILTSTQVIPHSVSIRSVVSNKNLDIDLKYSKVDINVPVELPFNIPQRFTIKN